MKRVRVILILLAVVVTGVLAAVVLREREPSYQGRSLSEWIEEEEQLQLEANGDSASFDLDPRWRAATNAVYQIGTNAVPWMVSQMMAADSERKSRLIKWLKAHPQLHLQLKSSWEKNQEGTLCLILLGDKAKAAQPALIELTHDQDAARRWAVASNLRWAQTDKETMTAVLRRLRNDRDLWVRVLAADFFKQLYPEVAGAESVKNDK